MLLKNLIDIIVNRSRQVDIGCQVDLIHFHDRYHTRISYSKCDMPSPLIFHDSHLEYWLGISS